MNTQISTPVKVFALAALVLALGMGGMMMLKGGGSEATAEPVTPVVHPTTPAATAPSTSTPAATTPASPAGPSTAPASTSPAATTPAATTPATPAPAATSPATTTPAHPAKPTVHAAPKPKPVVKPKPHLPPVAPNGLPRALDELLHIHRVVIVAVYDSEISTDLLFLGEAKAGALDAHAGFLAVNVLDEKVAGPLTAVAGKGQLLPSPGLLVFKQPDVLMNVITGFVDRAAVANAVANALVADAPNTATTPTTP